MEGVSPLDTQMGDSAPTSPQTSYHFVSLEPWLVAHQEASPREDVARGRVLVQVEGDVVLDQGEANAPLRGWQAGKTRHHLQGLKNSS